MLVMNERHYLNRIAISLAVASTLLGSPRAPAAPQSPLRPAATAEASFTLPPDTRAWSEKVAPEVMGAAAKGGTVQRVLVAFRVPAGVRSLEAVSPAAAPRLRWIAATADGLEADYASLGVQVMHRFSHLAAVAASVSPDALPALASDPRVDAIGPDRKVHALDVAGREYIGVPKIQPPFTGAGIGIAVLDTGVDYTNPELAPAGTKTIPLFDDYRSEGDPNYAVDNGGHGTEVAGIAAATGVNPSAIGVAPAATIVACKILDSMGNGSETNILDGIDAILSSVGAGNPYNIRVANMSFGGYFTEQGSGSSAVPPQPCDSADTTMADAFQQLVNAGVQPVVAAGNGGCTSGVAWPACVAASLAVGAVYDVAGAGYIFTSAQQCNGSHGCSDTTIAPGQVACFSDSGPKLDVLAPTCSMAPLMGGGYDSDFCGTSASAPYVSGLVALLAQAQPGASVAALKSALRSNGTPITDPRNGVVRNLTVADQALASLGCATPAAPSAATNKSRLCRADAMVLSWGAVAQATSYTVQEATEPSFAAPSATDTSALAFPFSSSLPIAATYYFRVRANTSCGTSSAWSDVVEVAYLPQCTVAYTHTYFVSGIAHLPGIAPAYWYTDLSALNPGTTTANLRLTFYGNTFPPAVLTTVAGHSQASWPDIVASLFGDSGPDKGVILVDSDQPLAVLSRTYSKVNDATTGATETFGQNYQGMEVASSLASGAVGVLPGLRSDGVFRTNVEFVNVGSVPTDVEFRFYTGTGALVATVVASVNPQRWGQIVRALPAGQPAAFAEVRALAAGAQILASASVIDGDSTDPTTIPMFVP
jgi:subtilisin family serine protease